MELEAKKTKGVEAVDKALSILKIFNKLDAEFSLTEISRRTGLIKSTAMRMLVSLAESGLVTPTLRKTYRIGPEAYRLGLLYSNTFSLEAVVRPRLHALMTRSGESASFFQRSGTRRVCLFREDTSEILREHIAEGDTAPLDRGAPGHVLVDFEHMPAAGRLSAQQHKLLPYVVTGERGAGITGIAAPIFSLAGGLVGAISLSGPATRFTEQKVERYRAMVMETAALMSEDLGSLVYA
jgi:DNA-binding IclR family transcriptional regulator